MWCLTYSRLYRYPFTKLYDVMYQITVIFTGFNFPFIPPWNFLSVRKYTTKTYNYNRNSKKLQHDIESCRIQPHTTTTFTSKPERNFTYSLEEPQNAALKGYLTQIPHHQASHNTATTQQFFKTCFRVNTWRNYMCSNSNVDTATQTFMSPKKRIVYIHAVIPNTTLSIVCPHSTLYFCSHFVYL